MLYNLRTDVIYYKSNSDFELEFNLCGCCRMRLLTDKPSNKKSFVHSLARAVSRSRVIIISGPIFGEENAIEVVSQALGTVTEIADNKAYNISSDDEIQIIKGSIPLVSKDGCFAGCIIESGPQTMVVLTDNKTLRKTIMSNLIHPYITELYNSETTNDTKPEPSIKPEEDKPIEETLITDSDYYNSYTEESDVVLEESVSLETPLILDNTEVFEESTPNIDINMFIEDEPDDCTTTPINERIKESQIILESEDDGDHNFPEEYNRAFDKLFIDDDNDITDEGYLKKPPLEKGYQFLDDDGEVMDKTEGVVESRVSHIDVLTIIISVILFLALIVICYCIFSVTTKNSISPNEYIQNIWNTLFG